MRRTKTSRRIGDLCKRVLWAARDAVPKEQRAKTHVQMRVSVALFVPKAVTPFQWDGQIGLTQIKHRIEVLKASFPESELRKKKIRLAWHDSATSYVEAVLARGGRECAPLIEQAWRNGARFDAWSDQFSWEAWEQAGEQAGVPIHCKRDARVCRGRAAAMGPHLERRAQGVPAA